jgi:phage protein D
VSEHAVLFEGVITRVVSEAAGSGARRVSIVAFDLSYQMMQGMPNTKDHTGSLSSIIKNIVGTYGIPIGQIALDSDPVFQDNMPLRQMDKRDWVFIQELAARYAARAFVEYNDGSSKFFLVSESRVLQGDRMGELNGYGGPGKLLEFRCQKVAASAAPWQMATVVDPDTGDPVVPTAPRPPVPETAPEPDPIRNTVLDQLGGGLGDDYKTALEEVGKAKSTPDKQRPQAFARGLPSDPNLPTLAANQDPTCAYGLHGEGIVAGTIHLRAKGMVGITGVANWADGDWYVRLAQHIVTEQNYWTRFVVSR